MELKNLLRYAVKQYARSYGIKTFPTLTVLELKREN